MKQGPAPTARRRVRVPRSEVVRSAEPSRRELRRPAVPLRGATRVFAPLLLCQVDLAAVVPAAALITPWAREYAASSLGSIVLI